MHSSTRIVYNIGTPNIIHSEIQPAACTIVFVEISHLHLWWVGLGWPPGAHQATLYHSPSQQNGGIKSKLQKTSWVNIKEVY